MPRTPDRPSFGQPAPELPTRDPFLPALVKSLANAHERLNLALGELDHLGIATGCGCSQDFPSPGAEPAKGGQLTSQIDAAVSDLHVLIGMVCDQAVRIRERLIGNE